MPLILDYAPHYSHYAPRALLPVVGLFCPTYATLRRLPQRYCTETLVQNAQDRLARRGQGTEASSFLGVNNLGVNEPAGEAQ